MGINCTTIIIDKHKLFFAMTGAFADGAYRLLISYQGIRALNRSLQKEPEVPVRVWITKVPSS